MMRSAKAALLLASVFWGGEVFAEPVETKSNIAADSSSDTGVGSGSSMPLSETQRSGVPTEQGHTPTARDETPQARHPRVYERNGANAGLLWLMLLGHRLPYAER
jgi:hypothetical protein